jgi:hypothetical protein
MHRDAGLPEPKVINTEMGVDGWRLDQERRKGEILPQKVLYCWASGHTGALLFGSRMTLGPNRVSQDFGFLDHWFCPRFVYGSMAALVETLGGATFEKVISEQDGVYIYQFSRGEDTSVAAFSTAEKQVVSFRKSGSDFSLVDPMGNQTPIQPGGNDTISLSLNGYPIYLFGRGELAYDSP